MILYVEDEMDDAFFMRSAFKKAGISLPLTVVEDGEKAVAYLAGTAPYTDRTAHPLPVLILLDLNLPLRSGFEVLEWIRSAPELHKLPVVIYSSSGRPEDRVRAESLGASGYLLKPSSGLGFIAVARQVQQDWLAERAPADS